MDFKVKKYFDKNPQVLYYIVGFVYLVFGSLICLWCVIINFNSFLFGGGSIFISFGIAYIAGGISRKSTIMTEAIMDSHFSDALGILEDRRLTIREKMEIIQEKNRRLPNYNNTRGFQINVADYSIYYFYSIWKCRTYLDRAIIFKEYFKDKHEKQLINQIDCLFQDLCSGKRAFIIQLNDEYISHVDYVYNKISEFDRFNRNTIGDEVRRMRMTNNVNYLKNQSNRICYFKHCDIV